MTEDYTEVDATDPDHHDHHNSAMQSAMQSTIQSTIQPITQSTTQSTLRRPRIQSSFRRSVEVVTTTPVTPIAPVAPITPVTPIVPVAPITPVTSVTSVTPVTPTTATDRKVSIRFRPIGGAPALANVGLCKIRADERWSAVIKFLNRRLRGNHRDPHSTVFCYIAHSFAPSPDARVDNVFDSYEVDGELMVSYCLVPAFG